LSSVPNFGAFSTRWPGGQSRHRVSVIEVRDEHGPDSRNFRFNFGVGLLEFSSCEDQYEDDSVRTRRSNGRRVMNNISVAGGVTRHSFMREQMRLRKAFYFGKVAADVAKAY
jgi:hypothetical protein